MELSMDSVQISPALSATASSPAIEGFTRFSLVRIVLALMAVCVPVALVLVLSNQVADKAMRAFWPPLLAALLGYCGYAFYVRKLEKGAMTEFSGPGVSRELGAGLVLGTLALLMSIGIAATGGSYQLSGTGSWVGMTKSLTEMVFIALIEEILFRGVLLRLSERSLGTWIGLVISSVIFAAAHLPNAGITALAVANTAVAGLMFGAAYLATRRLWLAVGMHFAWNFVSDGVFSLTTSGNPGHGLLQGQLSGPDWLTGGDYGLEGSAVTLVVLAVFTGLLLRHAIRAGHVAPRPAGTKARP
jgi:membrane protease YdiL (CAAX protease family)